MKKIIGFIFAVVGLVACKKDNNDTEIIHVNTAPKYKIVDFKSQPETYAYDTYGRQIKIVFYDGSRVESAYSKGKVTKSHHNSLGVLYRTSIIELNADGLQGKTYYKDTPGNYSVYEYGADKRITRVTSNYGSDITIGSYYYTDGNLDSTRYSTNNNWYLTNVYEYHMDQLNVQKGENSGITYYGEPSTHMCKSLTHNNANGTSINENYVYEYNAQGLVAKLTETTPTNTVIGYYTYY